VPQCLGASHSGTLALRHPGTVAPWHLTELTYSQRNATIGSTRDARRAGR
jgi:hypothetical protein